jgi:radical SAM protein with 4Fe4S-binding SPASM domain
MQNKGDFPGERIDFELYKKIIDRIVEQRLINGKENTPLQLVYHGGEVLLLGEEKLRQLLEYAAALFKANGIQYILACQTNATLLTEGIAKLFAQFGVEVGLSFDGIEGANSARTNLKQDVFASKFKLLEENKARFGFLLVASKTNIDSLPKTQAYLETLGVNENKESIVKGYKINYAEDMLNPGENSEIEVSGHEMFEKVWKPELEKFLTKGNTIEFHTTELLGKALVDLLTEHNNQTKSGCGTKYCGAGMQMIAIEPDGEMDYCDRYARKYDDIYMMHALDYDFLGINQLGRMVNYNLMKKGLYDQYGCNDCVADYICDHGCEAFYRSKTGEYGIDTRIICDQHIEFYQYVEAHLPEFLKVFADTGRTIDSLDYMYTIQRTFPEFDLVFDSDHNHIRVTRKPEKHTKVFMNRSVSPEDTYKLQKDWAEINLNYDLKIWNYGDFWTSKIQIQGHGKHEYIYSTTKGKGVSKYECLASNFGELIERYSYYQWQKKTAPELSVEAKSLINGAVFHMPAFDIIKFKGTEASGNNIEEARFHALCEVLELGFNNNAFRVYPVELGLLNTKNMFPELPEIIHDNLIVFFQKDPRISLYDVSVIRVPTENDRFFNNLIDIDFEKNRISVPDVNWNTSNPSSTIDKEHPWPSMTGRRVGLNIEKTVKIAIAEMLQQLETDSVLWIEKPVKKDVPFIKHYDSIEDLPDYETQSLEDDNALIINDFKNAGYNLWEVDITHTSDFPTVKIINDYTLGAMHPCSKQFMSKFFEI